jgi:hypothetical protein
MSTDFKYQILLFRPEKRLSIRRFRLLRHKSPSSLTKLPSSKEKIKTSKLSKSSPKKACRLKPTMKETLLLILLLMFLSQRRRRPLRWKSSYRNSYKADLMKAIEN